MEDSFKLEIISPEKIIFSDSAKMVKIPSYEGDMCILKDHISIITFLRPGLVNVEKMIVILMNSLCKMELLNFSIIL